MGEEEDALQADAPPTPTDVTSKKKRKKNKGTPPPPPPGTPRDVKGSVPMRDVMASTTALYREKRITYALVGTDTATMAIPHKVLPNVLKDGEVMNRDMFDSGLILPEEDSIPGLQRLRDDATFLKVMDLLRNVIPTVRQTDGTLDWTRIKTEVAAACAGLGAIVCEAQWVTRNRQRLIAETLTTYAGVTREWSASVAPDDLNAQLGADVDGDVIRQLGLVLARAELCMAAVAALADSA